MKLIKDPKTGEYVPEAKPTQAQIDANIAAEKAKQASEAQARATAAAAAFKGKNDKLIAKKKELMGPYYKGA